MSHTQMCIRDRRSEHHAPQQLLTEADCIRDSRAGDSAGKVLVMRPGVLRPEYWNAAHQLYFAVGGTGARAGGHGTKVFCINIYTGEHTYIPVSYTHLDVYKRQL